MTARAKLNHKQKVFVREYLIDGNATRAAIAAGYSPRAAESYGSQLLDNIKVAAEIEHLQSKQLSKLEITSEKALELAWRIASSNILDYVKVNEDGQADIDLNKVRHEQGYAIQEITVDTTGGSGDGERRLVLRTRLKLAQKDAQLTNILKHFKLISDKIEAGGPDGGPIQTSLTVSFVSPDAEAS